MTLNVIASEVIFIFIKYIKGNNKALLVLTCNIMMRRFNSSKQNGQEMFQYHWDKMFSQKKLGQVPEQTHLHWSFKNSEDVYSSTHTNNIRNWQNLCVCLY